MPIRELVSWRGKNKPKRTEMAALTLESPRGIVNQTSTQRLGVVGFEALNQELDGNVVHVGQGEASHVKDDGLKETVSRKAVSKKLP